MLVHRLHRLLFGVLVAGLAASLATLVVDCGGQPTGIDGSLPDAGDVDSSSDVAAASDAEPDWWNGCPHFPEWKNIPVVCPDADYFITINGDGPEQTLRSNAPTVWAGANAPGYQVPVARYQPAGENFPNHHVWASGSPDGGTRIDISPDDNTCYLTSGKLYCTSVAEAGSVAAVIYTQSDPPGGFVAGSYSAVVGGWAYDDGGMGGPTGEVMPIWGKFFACRICDLPPFP